MVMSCIFLFVYYTLFISEIWSKNSNCRYIEACILFKITLENKMEKNRGRPIYDFKAVKRQLTRQLIIRDGENLISRG